MLIFKFTSTTDFDMCFLPVDAGIVYSIRCVYSEDELGSNECLKDYCNKEKNTRKGSYFWRFNNNRYLPL